MKFEFWVEESDFSEREYHRVHAWGCKYVRDPETVVPGVATRDGLHEALTHYCQDEYEDDDHFDYMLAPCAWNLLSAAHVIELHHFSRSEDGGIVK